MTGIGFTYEKFLPGSYIIYVCKDNQNTTQGGISMESMAAPQARGKVANDAIFGASTAAKADIAANGSEKVVNATVGAILDEEERLVCLPTVGKAYRSLAMEQIISYAPVAGVPAFLKEIQDCCFGEYRPEGYTEAVSTTGGTGAIHHVIHNYTEPGDEVLTSNWYWSAYNMLCADNGRKLRTFRMLNEDCVFDHEDFEKQLGEMAQRQEHLAVILNTPAHNPTGYSLTDGDWDRVLDFLKGLAAVGKKIALLVDASYIDYAGEDARRFFLKFSGLPAEILVIIAFSMSKSFTMYGQRVGAMIAVSSSREIAREFKDINSYTNRATWSNNCHGGMECFIRIWEDPELRRSWKEEQQSYYRLIQERAEIFVKEAKEAGLPMLPYQAGFFLSIPSPDSQAVCEILKKDHIYLVPLKAGVRVAVCAIPKAKMHGIAAKIKAAMEEAGQL